MPPPCENKNHHWRVAANFRGHDSGGDVRFLFLEKELVEDDQALGEHMVVPGVAGVEENPCGVEAVHVSFPQPVQVVNLLNLAVGERAIVNILAMATSRSLFVVVSSSVPEGS
ncbi:hypothetical protein DEO72_LG8g992 [Vigna unguiculata]|uniref:Uncharacterized protein n=1 Tax=Vigna unguiculata TaxID=3917 RepID=A0A4D6MSX6_VIGUN|nr:hypothetical protein DEO72_LG8g992 [Vigna unguiculata]